MTTSSNVAGGAPDARVDAEMASRSDPRYPRTFTEVFGYRMAYEKVAIAPVT
jgi:hypothetical protein